MTNRCGKKTLWLLLAAVLCFACSTDNRPSPLGKKQLSSPGLSGYEELIVGTWRDNNSIATYHTDGTRSTTYQNGDESFGTWRIQGDLLFDTVNKYKKKNGMAWAHHQVYKMKILQLDKEKYSMRHQLDGSIWNATRMEKPD